MSGKDAVSCYKDFLEEIKGTETPLSEDLPFIMKKWRNICDSVQQCIKRDTVVLPPPNHQATFEIIHDSIKSEFYRLILSKERSYKDILLMKETLKCAPYYDEIINSTINDAINRNCLIIYNICI